MRIVPDSKLAVAGVVTASLVLGTVAFADAWHAPIRNPLLPDPPGGPLTPFAAFLVGIYAGASLIRWGYLRVRPSRRMKWVLRLVGCILLIALVMLTFPLGEGPPNRDLRFLAFGALTVVFPAIPTLAAALVFDLGLMVQSEGDRYGLASPRGPASAGAIAASPILGYVGVLSFGSATNEWGGPMTFESLTAPAVLVTAVLCPALALSLIAYPFALIHAGVRAVGRRQSPTEPGSVHRC